MKKQLINKLIALLTMVILITACEKDENGVGSGSSGTQKVKTTLTGRLVDEAGDAISGATVEIDGFATTTDIMGLFLFKNVNVDKKRCVINFTKSGYIDQYYACRPSAGNVTYTKPVMLAHESTQTVNSSTGGSVSLIGGGAVQFPSNSFVNETGVLYSGTVTVKITLLNSDDTKFSSKIPGRDLHAKDASGNDKILYSYGMINVELLGQASEKLQIAPGTTATLTFPVSTSQQASAPVSMPVWSLDPETAIWMEEGTALKNGNFYTTEVSHFTWWNCDVSYPLCTLSGDVIGCNASGAPNMDVFADYYLGYVTDNLGHYSGDAPAGYGGFEIYASDWNTLYSQTEVIPDLNTGQIYIAPDLILGTSNTVVTVQGELVDCNGNPTDGLVVFTIPGYGFYDYLYVIGGSFSLYLENNMSYDITAVNDGEYGQTSVNLNVSTPCGTTNIPNINVCGLINPGNTNLTVVLTSQLFGTQTLSYFVNDCQVLFSPSTSIWLTAYDSVNNSSGILNLLIDNYQPGNYTWNNTTTNLSFSADLNGNPVIIESEPGGLTTVTTAPPVGGMVNVSFNGNVIISSSQTGPIPATMTGNFNVLRN